MTVKMGSSKQASRKSVDNFVVNLMITWNTDLLWDNVNNFPHRPSFSFSSIVFLVPSGLPSRILTCTKLSGRWRLFVLVCFLILFLFQATCARLSRPHSAFESTLNSSIVSYRNVTRMLIGCAVFGSAAKAVRTNGTHMSCAVQDCVQSAVWQHDPCYAGLHQARTRPGGRQTLSEPRVQAALHRRRTPSCRRGPSTAPTRMWTQEGQVRRRPVHRTTQRHHSSRTTTRYRHYASVHVLWNRQREWMLLVDNEWLRITTTRNQFVRESSQR